MKISSFELVYTIETNKKYSVQLEVFVPSHYYSYYCGVTIISMYTASNRNIPTCVTWK